MTFNQNQAQVANNEHKSWGKKKKTLSHCQSHLGPVLIYMVSVRHGELPSGENELSSSFDHSIFIYIFICIYFFGCARS